MKLTKPQRFILFALGQSYEEFEKRFSDRPLEIALSKHAFIEIARKAGITTRAERTLYKNLESLEKRKLIIYNNRILALTTRGQKHFKVIQKELLPYIAVANIFSSQDILKYTRRVQTRLKK